MYFKILFSMWVFRACSNKLLTHFESIKFELVSSTNKQIILNLNIVGSVDYQLCMTPQNFPSELSESLNMHFSEKPVFLAGNVCDSRDIKADGFLNPNIFNGEMRFPNGSIYVIDDPIKLHISTNDSIIGYWNHNVDMHYIKSYLDSHINPTTTTNNISENINILLNNNNLFKHRRTRSVQSVKYCKITVALSESCFDGSQNSRFSIISDILRISRNAIDILNTQIGRVIGINFVITFIVIARPDDARFGSKAAVIKDPYLALRAVNNHNWDSCITIAFYKGKWQSILGLATVGTETGSGICHTTSSTVITTYIDNDPVPNPVLEIVIAHEIGHILGSLHDPADDCSECTPSTFKSQCSPGGLQGNYIMYPSANSGWLSNHRSFSTCSINYFKAVNSHSSHQRCLVNTISDSICGNGIIESSEDCDSGSEDDPCCNRPGVANACKLKSGSTCSPSQGNCCSSNCQFKADTQVCLVENECVSNSFCSGRSAVCSINQINYKPDGSFCNNFTGLCLNGACSESICMLTNKIRCQFKSSCLLSCKSTNQDDCAPLHFREHAVYSNINQQTTYYPAGYPCEGDRGFCSNDKTCTITKKTSKIIQIFLKIISGETIELLKDIFQTYTAISAGITCGYLTLSIVLIILCKKHTSIAVVRE